MKDNLVICLGNRLAGDDGVGWHIARWLAGHPDLPDGTDVLFAGSDLLRYGRELEDRARVVVVDAALDELEPGTVSVFEGPLDDWEQYQPSAHRLSPVQAIGLLRDTVPGLSSTRLTIIAITIACASAGDSLSDPIAAKLPSIVTHVLAELSD